MNENFIIASRTDVGKARQGNEDSMVTFDSPNGRVVAVCDGMGGMAAGDVASQLACDIITDILTNNRFDTPTEAITKAMQAANQGILYRTQQNPELEGMGATCVMVIIRDGMVYYGWVGDSRIYYINNGSITQLTRDQSHVQEMVDSGEMSSGEANIHPLKNEITNALGIASMRAPELCTTPIKPDAGSVVLLCSDGLTGMVDNNTICNVVSDGSAPLQQRADRLIDIANANGGHDNITVELIQFGGAPVAAPTPMPNRGGREPESKGSEGSKWMVWAAIVLGLIILGAGAWYIFFSDDKKEEPVKVTSTQATDDEDDKSPTELNNVGKSKGTKNTGTTNTRKQNHVVKENQPVQQKQRTVVSPNTNPTTSKQTAPKSTTNKQTNKQSTPSLPGVKQTPPAPNPTTPTPQKTDPSKQVKQPTGGNKEGIIKGKD